MPTFNPFKKFHRARDSRKSKYGEDGSPKDGAISPALSATPSIGILENPKTLHIFSVFYHLQNLANVEVQQPEPATRSTAEPAQRPATLATIPPASSTPAASANQLATTDKASASSLSLPKLHQELADDEAERDNSKLFSASQTAGNEGRGQIVTATPKGREQSGCSEDGPGASNTGQNLSDAELDAAKSLWDRAYEKLRDDESELVKKYKKLLSRELSKTGVYQLQAINHCN
jgi:hypothetical protein